MMMMAMGCALVATPALAASQPFEPVAEATARDLVDGRYDAVVARFDKETRATISAVRLQAGMDPLRALRGPAKALHLLPRGARGASTYVVDIEWTRGSASQLELHARDDGQIDGILIHDRPATAYDSYEPKVSLRLPFRGTWTAMNADRNSSNHHYVNPNQQFAVDWLIRDGHSKSFRGDGKRNSDYYAYGQEVLAPAAGVVVTVVDGVPENEPGPEHVDNYNLVGNSIVVDFGNREYALFAHLIPGSTKVHVGDHVTAGQPLARVGNSGHSTEPHLHCQLMDAPRLTDAHALPAKFRHVLVDGKPVELAWPVTGDRVSAAGEATGR